MVKMMATRGSMTADLRALPGVQRLDALSGARMAMTRSVVMKRMSSMPYSWNAWEAQANP